MPDLFKHPDPVHLLNTFDGYLARETGLVGVIPSLPVLDKRGLRTILTFPSRAFFVRFQTKDRRQKLPSRAIREKALPKSQLLLLLLFILTPLRRQEGP